MYIIIRKPTGIPTCMLNTLVIIIMVLIIFIAPYPLRAKNSQLKEQYTHTCTIQEMN